MNIPLTKEDYANIREEIKKIKLEGDKFLSPSSLDIHSAILNIINQKSKLLDILNLTLNNKFYWNDKKNKIENTYEYILNKAKLEHVEEKMNIEQRKAYAANRATEIISEKLFNGENYIQKVIEINEAYSMAECLYNEVRNIYNHMSDTMIYIGILQKNNSSSNNNMELI